MATPIPVNQAVFHAKALAALSGASIQGTAPKALSGVAIDSRAVTPGSIFVALRGDTHDGHAFIQTALERGASALVVEQDVQCAPEVCVVRVPDTRKALRELAAQHLTQWRRSARPVFCVTGSSGKTTTKEMLAALLSLRVDVCKTHGNLNNLVGVPMMVFTLKEEAAAVFEAGMSLPGEMDLLAALLQPDVSTIVNVGLAHAEGVGGPEGIAREKGAVYAHLSNEGIAVVNADDARAQGQASRAPHAKRVTFGNAGAYRLISRELDRDAARVVCRLDAAGRELSVHLPVLSPAQITDLLCALACAEARFAPFSATEITTAMASLRLEGRATIESLGDVTLIDDSYNANPESMFEAIRLLAELGQGKRTAAVVGDMRELGTYSVGAHEALADQLRDAHVPLVIGCGTEIVTTLRRLQGFGVETLHARDAEDAGNLALSRLASMDMVLVKASRGVALDRACQVLRRSVKAKSP